MRSELGWLSGLDSMTFDKTHHITGPILIGSILSRLAKPKATPVKTTEPVDAHWRGILTRIIHSRRLDLMCAISATVDVFGFFEIQDLQRVRGFWQTWKIFVDLMIDAQTCE